MSTSETPVAVQDTATGMPTVTKGRAVALVIALILGVLSYQLNASMLSPALPEMAKSLGTSTSAISQVTSLFFLAGAIGGVALSRWSDYIGRRQSLIVVLLILAIGTVICILAPNLPVLLIGRVLQGASSAAFQLSYVILAEALSAKVFGTALGLITAVNGGVGGFDGYVGGLLSDNFGYRSIFIVILTFGVVALIAVFIVVPKTPHTASTGRMDWWGAAVLAIGLICLTYFVSTGSDAGWTAPLTLLYLAGTLAAAVAFWFVERRSRSPLIAIQHLRSRQVWPLLATTLLTLSGIFAVINFTVVLLSQNTKAGFGLDAALSALLFLTPAALIGVFSAPLSGWLAGRVGWIRILRIGLALSVIMLIVIAIVPTSFGIVLTAVAVLGVTYNGLALTTTNGLGVLLSPKDAPAALPGLNGAAFGIGASLGIGIVAPFAGAGTIGGFTTALWISVVISVLALATSLLIRGRPGQHV